MQRLHFLIPHLHSCFWSHSSLLSISWLTRRGNSNVCDGISFKISECLNHEGWAKGVLVELRTRYLRIGPTFSHHCLLLLLWSLICDLLKILANPIRTHIFQYHNIFSYDNVSTVFPSVTLCFESFTSNPYKKQTIHALFLLYSFKKILHLQICRACMLYTLDRSNGSRLCNKYLHAWKPICVAWSII